MQYSVAGVSRGGGGASLITPERPWSGRVTAGDQRHKCQLETTYVNSEDPWVGRLCLPWWARLQKNRGGPPTPPLSSPHPLQCTACRQIAAHFTQTPAVMEVRGKKSSPSGGSTGSRRWLRPAWELGEPLSQLNRALWLTQCYTISPLSLSLCLCLSLCLSLSLSLSRVHSVSLWMRALIVLYFTATGDNPGSEVKGHEEGENEAPEALLEGNDWHVFSEWLFNKLVKAQPFF